jgi:hypothetical protein
LIQQDIVLALVLDQGRTIFEPGERVSGVASWSGGIAPLGIELRLIYTTHGSGGRDLTIADTIPFGEPRAKERRPFIFSLPMAPYSFRGNLISLVWALHLVAVPGEEKTLVELTVAPERRAIDIRSDDARRADLR